LFAVLLSVALIAAALSCSGSSRPDLHPFAVEICGQLRSDSPLGYQVPGGKPNAPQYLIDGLEGAQTFADTMDPQHFHLVTIREYSDALDSVCPQTVRRFLGGQSYYDWLTD